MTQPVTIAMIEDDEGHARLIEKNLRRAGVHNEIVPLADGASAIAYLDLAAQWTELADRLEFAQQNTP